MSSTQQCEHEERVKTPSKPDGSRRVALLIDTATTWGAGLIEGVADYAKANGKNWVFSFEPRGKYETMALDPKWRGDGVVARITTSQLAGQLIASQIPVVNVSWFRFGEGLIPRCTCDEAAAAEMAASYFLDNGFRQFAYCASTLRPSYFDRLGAAFVDTIGRAGYACETLDPEGAGFARLDPEQQLDALADWLEALPRPTALLTFDDIQARQVTEAAAQRGVAVPDDVAVLGGEHDGLCSRVSSPALSGIDQNPTDVGFAAAGMLDTMMEGKQPTETNLLLPPRRIIVRQSTDKVALEDDLLANALRYIRRHYADELSIRDILHEIPLSRRAMEMGFRRHLGRTPREEIRRIRVEKAVELLCDTDWPITKIARACGFDRPELLTRAFRREIKATPSEFRRRVTQRGQKGAATSDP